MVIVVAILIVRFRRQVSAWRSWHGALMSLTVMGSLMAMASIVGGVLVGDGSGPAFYRMFNGIIVVATALGLWLINTRPVIWGRQPTSEAQRARLRFTALAVAASLLLVIAQIPMSV
jgi:hypothetical protein